VISKNNEYLHSTDTNIFIQQILSFSETKPHKTTKTFNYKLKLYLLKTMSASEVNDNLIYSLREFRSFVEDLKKQDKHNQRARDLLGQSKYKEK
jgi:hypothetical protein